MRHIQPTTNLDVIGHLGLPAEGALYDVLESKRNDDLLVVQPRDPNFKLNDDIEILAIRNDLEHKEMLKLQKQVLENSARQSIIDTHRVTQVHQIIRQLRKDFIETNLFLQNSSEKRQQALKVVTDEKLVHAKFKEENNKLKDRIDALKEFRGVLANTVKELEPYERIIEQAATDHEVWTSPKDVMYRCDAMMLAQGEISQKKAQTILAIENIRQRMVKLTADASIAILGLNTTLNELDRDLMKARADSFYWEKILVNIKDCIVESERTTERMYGEVDRLYRFLCKRRRIYAVINDRDLEKRWDFIKNEFYIIKGVLKECTGRTKIFDAGKKKKKQISFKRSQTTIKRK